MRKVGIYYEFWTHKWDVDFIPFVKRVKHLGFDQLEVNAMTVAHLTPKEQRELYLHSEEEGITLSYGMGLDQEHDVSSLDERVRNRGIDLMKKLSTLLPIWEGGWWGELSTAIGLQLFHQGPNQNSPTGKRVLRV